MKGSGLQANSTFGMLKLAFAGIWKVTPIITYQVQQQDSELAQMAAHRDTDPLVASALNWWTERTRSYQREEALRHIMELEEVIAAAKESL